MATAAAVIVIKERHLVERFQQAGATAPDRARTLEELGVEPTGVAWRRLRDRAVIRESAPGSERYYADGDVWRALRRMRLRLVGIALVVALFLVVYALLVR